MGSESSNDVGAEGDVAVSPAERVILHLPAASLHGSDLAREPDQGL